MASPITDAKIDAFVDRYTWWLIYAAIGILSFDVLSTWVGICHLGGFELNILMTRIIQGIGFLPTALVLYGMWIVVGLDLRHWLVHDIKNRNWKMIMFVVVCLALLHYAIVVPNNGLLLLQLSDNDIFVGSTGEPTSVAIEAKQIPQSYVDRAIEEFDRDRFCRLYP